MDKSGKNAKGSKGEISLAGIDAQDAAPVHSSTLMEEFRKSPAFTKPAVAEKGYEFDNGEEDEGGVGPLSDEDVIKQ